MQRTYTEEERLTLLRQFMESGKSKAEYSRSVGLSPVSLSNWQERYGFPDPQTLEIIMKEKGIPSEVSSLQEELARLRREKRALEKALEKEKIRSLAFSTLIDLAESTYHIKVRKNSDISNCSRGLSSESSRTPAAVEAGEAGEAAAMDGIGRHRPAFGLHAPPGLRTPRFARPSGSTLCPAFGLHAPPGAGR